MRAMLAKKTISTGLSTAFIAHSKGLGELSTERITGRLCSPVQEWPETHFRTAGAPRVHRSALAKTV